MYKVVLIDDEDVILEGLRRVISWDRYGCEVVGTAGDALEGTALIREKNPDILFTDIRMPGRDGLTMLAGLRSEFPDMQVIVLTGFREFDYAREAVNLGVLRFLLKPSRMADLEEALSAAREKLSALHGKNELYEESMPAAGNFIVSRALEYIGAHFTEKITLQELADSCYVSQWHLSKLMNGNLGKSFYEIVNDMRIAKAKELLADPELRIGEISDLVGYSDPAHFSRIFKKLAGISPADFRNSL